MKKIILLVLGLTLFLSNFVLAVDYTISTNTRQEQVLTWIVTKVNTERAKQIPPLPPLTNLQYLKSIMNDAFQDYIRQYWQEEASKVKGAVDTKWDDITQAQRNQIKTILGVP